MVAYKGVFGIIHHIFFKYTLHSQEYDSLIYTKKINNKHFYIWNTAPWYQ